jgi:hypothetical protein
MLADAALEVETEAFAAEMSFETDREYDQE